MQLLLLLSALLTSLTGAMVSSHREASAVEASAGLVEAAAEAAQAPLTQVQPARTDEPQAVDASVPSTPDQSSPSVASRYERLLE